MPKLLGMARATDGDPNNTRTERPGAPREGTSAPTEKEEDDRRMEIRAARIARAYLRAMRKWYGDR